MAAPLHSVIPADVFATALLDRQLRATVARIGGDAAAIIAEDHTASLIAAAVASGHCASVVILADNDEDLHIRAEQFRNPGVRIGSPLTCETQDGKWQSIAVIARIGGEIVDVTIRGPIEGGES